MITLRDRRFAIALIVLFVVIIALLPAFVGFRYTAPEHSGDFVRRPWRGWAFVFSALAVPTDSKLKTSGMALRKAEWLFKGTVVDPQEVQLIYAAAGKPYTFTHTVDGREVVSTVTPSYDFIWQVKGALTTLPESGRTVVALLDYETGRVLYTIRDDLPPEEVPTSTAPAPSGTP